MDGCVWQIDFLLSEPDVFRLFLCVYARFLKMFLIPTCSSFQGVSTDSQLQAPYVSEVSLDPFKVSQLVLKSSDYCSLLSTYPPSTSYHQPSSRRYVYNVNELIALHPTPSKLPRQLRRKFFSLHIWKPK